MSKNIEKSLLITLGALAAFGPMTIDLYLPAFVEIGKDLLVATEDIQYSLTSFLAGLSIGQLIYGPISDRFGRKKPLLFGIIIFIITSVLISFAQNLETLIGLRFIQALGSCVGMVITRAIIRDMFEPREAAKVFSLVILIMGVAPVIAPVLGTQILLLFNWRMIFIFLALFGCLTLVGSIFKVPETLKNSVPLKKGFVNYFHLLKDRQFIIAALVSGTITAGMFSYIAGSAFVFLNIFKVSTGTYPIIFGANAFGFIVCSQVNARLLNTYSIDAILEKASIFALFAALCTFLSVTFHLSLPFFLVPLFCSIGSIGFIIPNITAKALEFQHERAAVASAMMGSIQFCVSSLGSVLVTVFANGTAWPLVTTLLVFNSLTFLLYFFGIKSEG
ncbi:multidrug effflux MFS transporter [Halobacteriovorax sp. JY17]|uniref:multidrug effflux MFS transporter n=1 Tax=Halobacteriovorax sp. JY17 TaxID=2014617 RepID=UPI000C561532|nr:multidrug effflux MFS transporter [Halobacteriovorax sp. JY17]PIK13784.1 MAG: Bcr/CflA family drug resistance efflux transporter [Halobacteriovorax sp. JY17]